MRTSTIALSVLLVGAASYATLLHLENAKLREELAARPVRPSSVEAALAEESSEVEALPAVVAVGDEARPVETVALAPQKTEEQQRSEEWQARRRERMERMRAAFDDPQMRADMIEQRMARVDERYADFFKKLDLDADELETLRVLMAEQGVVNWEMRMRSFGQDGEVDREAVEEERKRRRDLLDDEIAALLGEEQAKDLEKYTDSLPYREEVARLETSLSYSDTPLTKKQSNYLVGELQRLDKEYAYTNDLSGRRGPDMAELTRSDVDLYFREREVKEAAVLDSVSGVLTEEQLATFADRQIAEREREQRQMEFMLENGGREGRRWGGGPPRP